MFLALAPFFIAGADSVHAEGAVAAQNLAATATVDTTLALAADSVSIRVRPSALGVFKTGTVLYNWFAATAGTGTASMEEGDSAPSDIYPKGWHLPNNEGNGSWNRLLRVGEGGYEIATSSNGYSNSKVSWGSYNGIKTATANPVGLQTTGYFWGSKLQNTAGGYYWSRAAKSTDFAYYLRYYSSGANTVSDFKRFGSSVRCVSRS